MKDLLQWIAMCAVFALGVWAMFVGAMIADNAQRYQQCVSTNVHRPASEVVTLCGVKP